ncbi:MAG: hypothetical protein R2750_08525 [Bacteroidales bacterium]
MSIDKDCQQYTPRIDHYLKLLNENSLGIKLREGRIELKKRKGNPQNLKINENIEGNLEFWEKWSFELKNPNALPIQDYGTKEWIAVKKKRQMFLFEVADGTCFLRNRQNGQLKNGCIVELATVSVDGSNFWTLGLEAFGETGKMKKNLLVVCVKIGSGSGCPILLNKDSKSYPEWISSVIG